ncbi:hypothetical protein QYE76_023647 [Lolium multiflorum]|uniref:Uncharacterized protein n=1 Tax=Lolium multiflorum TaxID=4521 RepID=A0AAD8RC26_LOLMU|nr:hypothetical protein QYE76_023647 [Lolium multiflorum]
MAESSNANASLWPEDANGKQIRCTSYGQALYSLPGSKLIPKEASKWFSIFFHGLDNPLFFPYTESENFENPVSFRLDSFADDTSTRQLYSTMIRPCFLPVGMSTSNRIIKPGYESYQPVVAARQFGLGQVSPHFFLHHLTESRADLPDILTGQRRALGPLLKQLDAEYIIPAEQQQDGPEPTHADGSPFEFFPPAPMVLFCKNSPPLKKVVMQSQPISPKSASKSKVSSGPAAPRASTKARTSVRKVAARKTLKRRSPSPSQESLHASTEDNSSEETPSNRGDSSSDNSGKITTQSQPDLPPSASRKRPVPEPVAPQAPIKAGQGVSLKRTRKEPQAPSSNQEASTPDNTSSGGVEEVQMPSANLDPVVSAVDKGCDLAGLLTFDPESIEPAPSTACDEPRPSAVLRQFQRLKALLSSPIETLVEDPEEVKSVLEEIKHHLPVTLQVKLWPVVTLSVYGSRVKLARQRINLRHAQLPLKVDIADKCRRLNEKKAVLDAKTDTSVSTAELETLRKELADLEERVRATKQLIYDKEALIARSQEEAEGLKAQLKTDLAEIRALNKQLVAGEDEDDEAEIAEVDRVRADALRAFEAFLQ